MFHSESSQKGVSEALGEIIMVAVIIVLMAMVGSFYLTTVSNVSAPPEASVKYETNIATVETFDPADGNIEIENSSLPGSNTEEPDRQVQILDRNRLYVRPPNPSDPDSPPQLTFTDGATTYEGDTFAYESSTGRTFEVSGDSLDRLSHYSTSRPNFPQVHITLQSLERAEKLEVVYEGQVVGEFEEIGETFILSGVDDEDVIYIRATSYTGEQRILSLYTYDRDAAE